MFIQGLILISVILLSILHLPPVTPNALRPAHLRALIVGDWGNNNEAQKAVSSAMANWATQNRPDFIISVGDNFYTHGIKGIDDPKIDLYWYNIYNQTSLRKLNLYVSLGNHDYGEEEPGREWNQVQFSMIEPRWKLPHLWHSFRRDTPSGTCLFLFLDTEAFIRKTNNHELQYDWLKNELMSSIDEWRVVIGHHPLYSTGGHAPGSFALRGVLEPLFMRYAVDFYITGHDHNMEHVIDIKHPDVTDHVINGAGGRPLNTQNTSAHEQLRRVGKASRFFTSRHGFGSLEIGVASASVDYYDTDSHLVYKLQRSLR